MEKKIILLISLEKWQKYYPSFLYLKMVTQFQPIYVNDLSLMIFNLIKNFQKYKNKNIPAVGHEIFTLENFIHIFQSLQRKERFINIPSFLQFTRKNYGKATKNFLHMINM